MIIQGRDKKTGRWLRYSETNLNDKQGKKIYTLNDIREAYIAGYNNKGGIDTRPSIKAERYLKENNYL
jgi:hypothetical protein